MGGLYVFVGGCVACLICLGIGFGVIVACSTVFVDSEQERNLRRRCTNYLKILEPLHNSSRQKGDMKLFPC
jgi:hypothetical protein